MVRLPFLIYVKYAVLNFDVAYCLTHHNFAVRFAVAVVWAG